MVTGTKLTGYIVNVMRSQVIERLLVRGSQVALKHVFHDMEIRTLLMELRRRTIKRWVPCGDMDCRLKIPHSAKVKIVAAKCNKPIIIEENVFFNKIDSSIVVT